MRALSDAHKRGVTVFIITQRERVLAGVDKIMRIQNGKLLDFDTREKVLERLRDLGARSSDQGNEQASQIAEQTKSTKVMP